jgi:hypothetical protein
MAGFDHALYHDTKQNLMAAAKGDPDVEDIVLEQLQDMKETGYFNIEE